MDSQALTRYFDGGFKLPAVKILPGQYYAGAEDGLIVTVLGSCVSACLWDPVHRIGGMNHFMLPGRGRGGQAQAPDAQEPARLGVYRMEALEGLERECLRRHFLRGTGANGELARVRPELRAMVKFQRRNLLEGDWPQGERFDVVFCRNVMIYFDRATQQRVLDRLAGVLPEGGLLFVGHADSGAASHAAFRSRGKTIYERRAA